MTLNNNPRVTAEKRLGQLYKRRYELMSYKSLRNTIEYEDGMAARMFINPHIKVAKAGKLIDWINKEIKEKEKFLIKFK